jgi:hypothetical protein
VASVLHPSFADADSVLWHTSADLDGDGRRESIQLTTSDAITDLTKKYVYAPETIAIPSCAGGADECTVTLRVGSASHALTIDAGHFGAVGVRVIEIDRAKSRRALVVRTNGGDGEDPPFDAAIVFYSGRRLVHRPLVDTKVAWSHVGDVKSTGKGTLVVEYAHCPYTTTVRYRVSGTLLKERGRTITGDPEEVCSACPHVYVADGRGQRYAGEILRDLSAPSLEATQSLSLGARIARQPLVSIELREEKRETTYLDEIYLEVDGERITPAGCADRAWCASDRRYHVMRIGDRLTLQFRIDDPSAARSARLVATGYYVPE